MQERWGYICPDIAKEFAKYEQEPAKWIKKFESVNSVTKKVSKYDKMLSSWGFVLFWKDKLEKVENRNDLRQLFLFAGFFLI